jgi:hypothetical protein
MVAPAMENGSWATDIGPNLGVEALQEFLSLWLRVSTWEPDADVPDTVSWSWEANNQFSVRSAYVARFWGRTVAPTTELSWESRAPSTCKLFTWLALRDRC